MIASLLPLLAGAAPAFEGTFFLWLFLSSSTGTFFLWLFFSSSTGTCCFLWLFFAEGLEAEATGGREEDLEEEVVVDFEEETMVWGGWQCQKN